MPENRFYIDADLTLNMQYELTGEEMQHLKVMRCREGEVVELINGRGILAQAKILFFDKRSINLEVLSVFSEAKSNVEFIIAQAIPRLNRLEAIIEKCTELGIHKFLLFPGETSEKKELSSNQIHRIEHIFIAASKQCGRLLFPALVLLPKLSKWKKPDSQLYFGDVASNAPLFKGNQTQASSTIFFIGPESGFSQEEVTILKSWQAEGVKLNSSILRTDTAAITAAGLMAYFNLSKNL